MIKITERRIVKQDWYETQYSKTGWDSHGWIFDDGTNIESQKDWTVIQHIHSDKFGNPIIGIAEREQEI